MNFLFSLAYFDRKSKLQNRILYIKAVLYTAQFCQSNSRFSGFLKSFSALVSPTFISYLLFFNKNDNSKFTNGSFLFIA